jgi:hypothetical protein
METQPTTVPSTLVSSEIKSCLDCKFSGFLKTVDRPCTRDSTKIGHFPTCLGERSEIGECGPDAKFFQPFYVKPISPIPPPVNLKADVQRALEAQGRIDAAVKKTNRETWRRDYTPPPDPNAMNSAEWIALIALASVLSFLAGVIVQYHRS